MTRRIALAAGAAGVAVVGLVLQACGFGGIQSLPVGDGGTNQDSSIPEAGPPAPLAVRVVVVNGLTHNVAVSDAGNKTARDVRLCFNRQGLALPSTGTMPLANYPGIPRGRGLDFGEIAQLGGQFKIDALDANDVRLSTANGECAKLTEPLGGAAAYVPSATATAVLVAGVNLLVLRDNPSGGISIDQAVLSGTMAGSPLDAGLDAGPRPIRGQFGVFSSWLAGDGSVNVDVDQDGGVANLASAIGAGTLGPRNATASLTFEGADPYEASSLSFRPAGGAKPAALTQTFGSIQYVSDPTTSPAVFFDRRESFVFVVVGDAADTTALDVDGGRKAGFDGAELHVVAVPYAN